MTDSIVFLWFLAVVALGCTMAPQILEFRARRLDQIREGEQVDRELLAALPQQMAQLARAQELGIPLGPIRQRMAEEEAARIAAVVPKHYRRANRR